MAINKSKSSIAAINIWQYERVRIIDSFQKTHQQYQKPIKLFQQYINQTKNGCIGGGGVQGAPVEEGIL